MGYREQLLESIKGLAEEALRYDEKNAAIVLYTLAGSMYAVSDDELASFVQVFAQHEHTRLKAREN